jgi:ParB family chromosome partitioning protein
MSSKLNFNQTEEARRNRLSAMVDDSASETAMAAADARGPDPFDGRKQLREACAIRLDRIVADPDQPRKDFDQEPLEQLAASIKAQGVLQPLRVRWDAARGVYIVIVGERRYRAARLAGLEAVPCVVVSGPMTATEILETQLVENALREGLKPAEQAWAIRTLAEQLGLTQEQVAAKLHLSQGTVSQMLTLTTLPQVVQDQVDTGALAPSVAYQIAKVQDAALQQDLADRVIDGQLTRTKAAKLVRQAAGGKGRGAARSKSKSKGPSRLPTELKHRGARGVRLVAHTAARHTLEDVLADLEEFAGRIREQMRDAAQDAA